MKIVCKSQASTIDVPVSQLVNRVGKYLKKSLDGAYSYVTGPNTCDVKFTAYYQIPTLSIKPGRGETEYSDLHEMSFDISLTTYSNKIRVNLVEISPEEMTLGHFVVAPEKLHDMVKARELILDRLKKYLNKYFEGYIFIF